MNWLRPRFGTALFAVLVATLFFAANREAYNGFWAVDDPSNLVNASGLSAGSFLRPLITPSVTGEGQFRAVPYFFYYALLRLAGMNFPVFIAAIQAVHLLNLVLLWMLARALGAGRWGAGAAVMVYAVHAAACQVYWQSMYAFDLLAATCVLACLLAYVRGWWIAAIPLFWLALKSKESVILLPAALLAYEVWIGQRRWKRTIPFFAITAAVGAQALLANAVRDNTYTFRFTLDAVWQTSRFYAEWLGLAPYLGFAALLLPLVSRDRRVWFGCATFTVLLIPLLFLPGRLFAAYLYAPMIGLAIAASAIQRRAAAALLAVVWVPWNLYHLDRLAQTEQSAAVERRTWYDAVAGMLGQRSDIDTLVFDGVPSTIREDWIDGMLALRDGASRSAPLVATVWIHAPEAGEALQRPGAALVVWDGESRTATTVAPGPDLAYVYLDARAPVWQLLEGWAAYQGRTRWMEPHSVTRLSLPPDAAALEVDLEVNGTYLDQVGPGALAAVVDGVPVGQAALEAAGPATFQFPLPANLLVGDEARSVEVELTVDPPLQDPNGPGDLGQPVVALGFRP